MRFATLVTPTGLRLHVRRGDGYTDVAAATGNDQFASIEAVLAAGSEALEAIAAVLEQDGHPQTAVGDADLAPALPAPRRILCLGLNYTEHALEGGREVPDFPESFVRGPDSVAAPFGPLVRPRLSERFDYEGELGVVIGRGGRYITAADALAAVAGFVVVNDGSAREWQRAATQWTPGKNFDGTMPIGPELVTADEVDVSDLALETRLNGQVMQSARTSQMIIDVPSAVEFFSSFTTLRPGDVIATGTPGGVGFARKPPVWLRDGDVIEVEIEQIGTIRNTVVDEQEARRDPWRWTAPVQESTSL